MLGFMGTTCYAASLTVLGGLPVWLCKLLYFYEDSREVQKLPNTQCLGSGFRGKREAGVRRDGAGLGWQPRGRHTDEKGPRVQLGLEGANPKSLGCRITRLGGFLSNSVFVQRPPWSPPRVRWAREGNSR